MLLKTSDYLLGTSQLQFETKKSAPSIIVNITLRTS